MKKESDVDRTRPQIATDLLFREKGQLFGCLVLDDHSVVDDHVQPLPASVPTLE
jgi:hypothetical protein